MDPELLERITARRADLDELEERLAKHLAEVRAERDELAVAERVLERVSEQLADERASAATAPGQVGGRAVMLNPHRTPDMEETMLPPDYQRILAVAAAGRRAGDGPAGRRHVGGRTSKSTAGRGSTPQTAADDQHEHPESRSHQPFAQQFQVGGGSLEISRRARVDGRLGAAAADRSASPEFVPGFHGLCLVKPVNDEDWYIGSLKDDDSVDCWSVYDDLYKALHGL
ncbi:hypothetical protein [Streptomyces sp. NPDC006784]|uniref:hypothetical protein n=1 Tax=Streptomyces sp. NPDC006784 TaxID=3364764 RepID=UPI0036A4C3AD